MAKILSRKEVLFDDRTLVENALNLWLACCINHVELVNELYAFENIDPQGDIKNVTDLFLAGLYCYKNYRIRDEFLNALIAFSTKVRDITSVARLPVVFLLDALLRNFPKKEGPQETRESKEFFELLNKLLDDYFTLEDDPGFEKVFEPATLFAEVVDRLKGHVSRERKNSIIEDRTLIGYLNLISKLIQKIGIHQIKLIADEKGLMEELFNKCLFPDDA